LAGKTVLQLAKVAASALSPPITAKSPIEMAHHALHSPPNSSALPQSWVVGTIAPGPVSHYSRPVHLLFSRTISRKPLAKSDGSVFVKSVLPGEGLGKFMREFDEVIARMNSSLSPMAKREWWASRLKSDSEMKVSVLFTIHAKT